MYRFNNHIGEIFYKQSESEPITRMPLDGEFIKHRYSYYISSANYSNLNIEDFGFIIANDENLKAENNLFELIFEATAYQDGSRWLYPPAPMSPTANIPRYQYDSENIKKSKFQYDKSPKLLLAYGNRQLDLYFLIFDEFISGAGNNYPLKYVAPITENGTSIQAQTLLDKYYKVLRDNILSDMRIIEDAVFYLTPQDVAEFDPFTPIYLDSFGSYFFVNKIKNFIAGQLTKVDLIKI